MQAREGLRIPFFSIQGAPTDITVEVPADRAWRLDIHTVNTGAVTLQTLDVAGGRIVAGIGRIDVAGVHLQSDLTASTTRGRVRYVAAGFADGATLLLATKAGDVDVAIPPGAYDLRAVTDIGTPRVTVDGVAVGSSPDEGDSAVLTGRTPDYESQPLKVAITASSAIGDVTLRSG